VALRFYDEALVNKIKKWTQGTQVEITGPDETRRIFEITADKNNDKPIQLPLICIRRGQGFEVLQPNKKPLSFDGATLEANYKKSIQLNAIAVSIPYQIDIYTRHFAEADEYVRNFIFNIINFPKLEVNLPYLNSNVIKAANIRLNNNIEDNSGIPERLIPGQFTRFTLTLYIDDAYLFDLRVRDNYSIETQVEAELQSYNK
jgi:hypothetical protein